jgi:hypothetical protein
MRRKHLENYGRSIGAVLRQEDVERLRDLLAAHQDWNISQAVRESIAIAHAQMKRAEAA